MSIAFLRPACGLRRRSTQGEGGSSVVCREFRADDDDAEHSALRRHEPARPRGNADPGVAGRKQFRDGRGRCSQKGPKNDLVPRGSLLPRLRQTDLADAGANSLSIVRPQGRSISGRAVGLIAPSAIRPSSRDRSPSKAARDGRGAASPWSQSRYCARVKRQRTLPGPRRCRGHAAIPGIWLSLHLTSAMQAYQRLESDGRAGPSLRGRLGLI